MKAVARRSPGRRPTSPKWSGRRFGSGRRLAGRSRPIPARSSSTRPTRRSPGRAAIARFTVSSEFSGALAYLAFGLTPAEGGGPRPFADRRTREAVRLALDVPALLAGIGPAAGYPATQIIPSGVFGFDHGIRAPDPGSGRGPVPPLRGGCGGTKGHARHDRGERPDRPRDRRAARRGRPVDRRPHPAVRGVPRVDRREERSLPLQLGRRSGGGRGAQELLPHEGRGPAPRPAQPDRLRQPGVRRGDRRGPARRRAFRHASRCSSRPSGCSTASSRGSRSTPSARSASTPPT